MIEHLISTMHRLVWKILLSLRLRGTVAYIYTRTDRFFSNIILIMQDEVARTTEKEWTKECWQWRCSPMIG